MTENELIEQIEGLCPVYKAHNGEEACVLNPHHIRMIADLCKAHYIGNVVDILPCDVKLQDGITVRKGCNVDTLITVLRNRDKFNKQHGQSNKQNP